MSKTSSKKFAALVLLLLLAAVYVFSLIVDFRLSDAIVNGYVIDLWINLGFVLNLAWIILLLAELAILISEMN